MHPFIDDFKRLFRGFHSAYGIYNVKTDNKPGKVKGNAASVQGEVTSELWDKHLSGEQGLGIVPIDEKNECSFGAIDVDDYTLDPSSVARRVAKMGLPLVPCRTKSGGVHLYCFINGSVSAALMKEKLAQFASALGFGTSEIFPKQSEILADRGDTGSWINMPYLGGNSTERYAFQENGLHIKTVEAFVKFAYKQSIDPDLFINIHPKVSEPLGSDAPPCLNCLFSIGVPEGGRNNTLMQAGIFYILKDPDAWTTELEKANQKYFDPAVSASETLGVIKSLRKKEYRYLCNAQPMASYCNKALCKTRKYGIGGSTGMPASGTLTKLCTSPVIWFVEVEGAGRVELTTEDLQQPLRYQRSCMEQLGIMPNILKRDDWADIVRDLMDNCTVKEVPPDATPKGQLMLHLEEFCTTRAADELQSHDVLLLGQVWNFDDRHFFRMKDFMAFLRREKFDDYKQNRIEMILKEELHARKEFFNIKGRGCNCRSIKQFVSIDERFSTQRSNTDEVI